MRDSRLCSGLFYALVLQAPICLAQEPAKAVVPKDFAFGITLTPMRREAIHAFTLPEAVLSAATDSDLGDLCVFDAQGAQRPLALHEPCDTPRSVAELPLAHFPLEQPAGSAQEGTEVRVERDPRGNITRAFSTSVEAHDPGLRVLVDASEIRDPIVGLNLALSGPRDFTLRVQVDQSEDLASFQELTHATVAHLEHGGRTLSRDLVELPQVHAHYLRITITPARGIRDLSLDSVSARVEHPGSAPVRSFVELSSHQTTTRDGQVFAYRLPGVFHVDRYGVVLPGATELAEVTLLTSGDAKAAFRVLDRGLFRRDDTTRELPRTDDEFFELRVSDKGGGIREGAPKLRLGYVAPLLLFAGDGAEPYLLAYGSATARCRRFEEGELVSITQDGADYVASSDSVSAGPVQTLTGGAALVAAPAPRPLRLYVLWAVLIFGVGVLAFVTRKLLRSVE